MGDGWQIRSSKRLPSSVCDGTNKRLEKRYLVKRHIRGCYLQFGMPGSRLAMVDRLEVMSGIWRRHGS